MIVFVCVLVGYQTLRIFIRSVVIDVVGPIAVAAICIWASVVALRAYLSQSQDQ